MANLENIARLSKYQMRILYYKCKEGATHAQIAALLDRDVNTVQYHMTKIYTILDIKQPGKSKEMMESELLNEVGPVIRGMFNTYEDVKIWAPVIRDARQEEEEQPAAEDPLPPYVPPPSVERFLNHPDRQPVQPEIIAPPPPGRRRVDWWLVVGFAVIGVLIMLLVIMLAKVAKPVDIPMPPTQPLSMPTPIPTEVPTSTPTELPSPTPTQIPTLAPQKDGMVMISIPEGEFKMGVPTTEDPGGFTDEQPQHVVYLDTYWIDQTEVSNAQYALCVADSGACTKPANTYAVTHPSYYDDSLFANYPVVYVSWSQAAAYCSWAGRRLPTEAEWEKAARGLEGNIYPWGNTFDGTLVNFCDSNCQTTWKNSAYNDGYAGTSPVGAYPGGASVFGVLDMAGNVHEWVADWHGPYSGGPQSNPTGPASGLDRIIRGGSWGDDTGHVRSDIRSSLSGDNWLDFIGFRCAR
jgi:eukaryotic-like serine/threonine-protein kinase